jgi:hypothetical protein
VLAAHFGDRPRLAAVDRHDHRCAPPRLVQELQGATPLMQGADQTAELVVSAAPGLRSADWQRSSSNVGVKACSPG